MPTNVNKNTATNKNHININIDLDNAPKRKRRQRKKAPPQEPSTPDVLSAPNLSAAAPHSVGITAFAPRPVVYAPSSTMIAEDNRLPPPAYFERQLTNIEHTMKTMRQAFNNELEDLRNGVAMQMPPASLDAVLSKASTEFESQLSSIAGGALPPLDIDRIQQDNQLLHRNNEGGREPQANELTIENMLNQAVHLIESYIYIYIIN
jgi:hypothetical protein